jgi:beta-lactamase superfamily II metal-dependent hydrolase
MSANDLSINVRMYRQGLGDCFLLTFKKEDKAKFNLLIDCGLLQGTENAPAIMREVAEDIKLTAEDTGGLNAVAVTHEHWDHISGFSLAQAQDVFDQIKFHEVWLGWTEDESHPQSKAMRERFSKQIDGVKKAVDQVDEEKKKKQGNAGGDEEELGFLKTAKTLLTDFFDPEIFSASGKGRSATWEYITKKGPPRYCDPGTVFSPAGLEDDVRIYVLGPPADYKVFTKTEPSKKDAPKETYREDSAFALTENVIAAIAGRLGVSGQADAVKKTPPKTEETSQDDSRFALAESFFAAFGEKGDDPFENACPFETDLPTILPYDTSDDTPHEKVSGGSAGHTNEPCWAMTEKKFPSYFADENDWRQIGDDWLMMVEQFALHLDSYTNNSCLAFAIELVKSGKVLLFPGDAQYGNWISWKDLEFKDKDGKIVDVTTADLMSRTVLYKVGHHGSHNATLREHGLELMTHPELVAMIPVDREMAKSKTTKTNKTGWQMPEGHLFDRLKQKTRGRIIIADESDHTGLKDRCTDPAFYKEVETGLNNTKVETPVKFAGKMLETDHPLYVEYEVKN